MWFKRKKKADPDSALTETLRSLQVLLEDEDASSQRLAPKATKATPAESEPPKAQTGAAESSFAKETQTDKGTPSHASDSPDLVATETQAVQDIAQNGKPIQNDATSGASPSTPIDEGFQSNTGDLSNNVESPERTASPNEDLGALADAPNEQDISEESLWVDPFRQEEDLPVSGDLVLEIDGKDLADDDIVVPAIDTIPVLTDIVYEPIAPSVNTTTTEIVNREALLELCVNDLRERLRQNNLVSMDTDQEQKLRQILTSILGSKSTSKPE